MRRHDELLGKLDRLRQNRQRIQAENRRKLEQMGLLGVIEKFKDGFGEIRLEGAISRAAPYYVGDRDRCRRWWARVYGGK